MNGRLKEKPCPVTKPMSENKPQFPLRRGEWQELDREVVYDNPWIQVQHSSVLNPNGGRGIYGMVHFKNLAIGIIPIDEEGNTYLVGQERFPLDGAYTWEIIEGGGPLGHSPLESAQRELQEEAGLAAHRWQPILEMDLSNSATDEKAIIYLAEDLYPVEKQPEETEKLSIKKVPFKSLYEAVLSGEIRDSLSVAGTLKLALLKKALLD